MTASPPVPRERDANADLEDRPRCAMCDHRLADHDAIGLRYCQATQAQALARDCICRVQ